MQYAQLNQDGSYSHQITTSGNVEWDDTHLCPASALTPEESTLFRVVPLLETDVPAIDPLTQTAMRDGGELVNGAWQYKWRIDKLSEEAIAQKTIEQVKAAREAAKAKRTADVAAITVTTSSGHVFNGDETSQGRMARAILVLQATNTPSTIWVLADNTPVNVTVPELVEALALAGAAQSALWVIK